MLRPKDQGLRRRRRGAGEALREGLLYLPGPRRGAGQTSGASHRKPRAGKKGASERRREASEGPAGPGVSCRQRRGRSQEVSGVQWCLPVGARPRARPAGASWTRQSEVTCMLRGKRESFPVRKTPSPCPVGQKQPRNHTESWGVSRPLLSHAVDTPGVSRECQGTHPRSGVGARRPRLAIQTRSTSPSLLITRGL